MAKAAIILMQVILAYLRWAKSRNKLTNYQERELLSSHVKLTNLLRVKKEVADEVKELSEEEVAAALGINRRY